MLVRSEAFGEPRRHCGVVDLAQSVLQLFETAKIASASWAERWIPETRCYSEISSETFARGEALTPRVRTNRPASLRGLGVEAIEQLSGEILDVALQDFVADLIVSRAALDPGRETQHQGPEGWVLQLAHATLMRCAATSLGGRPHHLGKFSRLRRFADLRQDFVAKDVPVARLANRPAPAPKLALEQARPMRSRGGAKKAEAPTECAEPRSAPDARLPDLLRERLAGSRAGDRAFPRRSREGPQSPDRRS